MPIGFAGGGGEGSNDPLMIFEDASTRDAFYAIEENRLLLLRGRTDILLDNSAVLPATEPQEQIWGGVDAPATYDNALWIDRTGGVLSAAEIKTLYESNTDTEALRTTKLAVLDLLSVTAEGVLKSEASLEVPPGTVFIGPETGISASIRAISIRSGITGNNALLLAQLFDGSAGFGEAFTYSGVPSVVGLNPAPGTDVSDTAVFHVTATADELIHSIFIQTESNNTLLAFSVVARTGSQAGPVAVSFSGSVGTGPTGVATIDLLSGGGLNPIMIDSGMQLFFDVTCQGMIGVDTAGVFVPNADIGRIVVTRNTIVTRADLPSLGSGSVITTGERTKLAGVEAGAEANVQSDWGEDDTGSDAHILNRPAIPVARTDEEIRDVMGATLVAGSAISIAVDDVANTITISVGGGGGTPPPADAGIIYYGLSNTNDPATVLVSSLTTENDPTDPDTIQSGVATAGDYFILLVPTSDDLVSIFDTVAGQPVTSIFTRTENVRTLNSELYTSYVVGPLNAGFDETYVINF